VGLKLSVCLTKNHFTNTYGGAEVYLHALLASAVDGGEWSASNLGCFTPGEETPGTHWIEGWLIPRNSLDAVAKRKLV
jgi:hypothetical protein